jgi:pimeloyl-ACP methyl ester carboxylesterase
MAVIEGAGVELAYEVHGSGPDLLLIHGLAADRHSWTPLLEALAGEARAIVYDRRGYGDSGAPEPYERTTVEEQAEDAAALLAAVAPEGALICGDGFGALVALDLLKRHRSLTRGAVLSNPPLFAFVPTATEVLAGQRDQLERALRDGGPEAAVEAWLGGRVDDAALARARTAHRAFFADFAGLASWPVSRAELRAIDAPLVVLSGPQTPPSVLAAADVIADLAPAATRATHGAISTAVRELL